VIGRRKRRVTATAEQDDATVALATAKWGRQAKIKDGDTPSNVKQAKPKKENETTHGPNPNHRKPMTKTQKADLPPPKKKNKSKNINIVKLKLEKLV